MASHQTTNFQLCQWEADDEVLRTDFNADNLKIENALSAIKTVADAAYTAENSPVAIGWYQGNDAVKRKIELGFTPKAVLVIRSDGATTFDGNGYSYCGGVALTGRNASTSYTDGVTEWNDRYTVVAITQGGFYVNCDRPILSNYSGYTYYYIVFR